MNNFIITEQYYSKWLGIKENEIQKPGINLYASEKRNQVQVGYAKGFEVYVYLSNNVCKISYRNDLEKRIGRIFNTNNQISSISEIRLLLETEFELKTHHSIKFVFDKPNEKIDTRNVRKLNIDEYDLYSRFFISMHKLSESPEWLKEYFIDNCNKEYNYVCFADDKIVSCTDGPDMPYMADQVQTLGINTLKNYWGNGYASKAVSACIKNMLANNVCPLWSCNADNIASIKLAEKVGFVKLADVVTISGVK